MISQDEFAALAAQGYNRIPVVREVFSDLDTPLSVYLKLADGPYTYLLESVEGGENWGRYSIIGLPCRKVYKLHAPADCRRSRRRHRTARACRSARRDRAHPRRIQSAAVAADAGIQRRPGRLFRLREHRLHRTQARALGSSRPARHSRCAADAERRSSRVRQPQGPAVHHRACRSGAAAGVSRAHRRLDELAFRLRRSGPSYPEVLDPKALEEADFVSSFTREQYEAIVEKAKEYIRAGDIFQVVPSQRLSVPFRARPVDVYRAARAESVAVHVFPRSRRHPDRRLVAGNPGAPEKRQGRAAPDRRHAPARQDARRRSRARSRTACRSRRSAPSI